MMYHNYSIVASPVEKSQSRGSSACRGRRGRARPWRAVDVGGEVHARARIQVVRAPKEYTFCLVRAFSTDLSMFRSGCAKFFSAYKLEQCGIHRAYELEQCGIHPDHPAPPPLPLYKIPSYVCKADPVLRCRMQTWPNHRPLSLAKHDHLSLDWKYHMVEQHPFDIITIKEIDCILG
jgi:hypothetical protein